MTRLDDDDDDDVDAAPTVVVDPRTLYRRGTSTASAEPSRPSVVPSAPFFVNSVAAERAELHTPSVVHALRTPRKHLSFRGSILLFTSAALGVAMYALARAGTAAKPTPRAPGLVAVPHADPQEASAERVATPRALPATTPVPEPTSQAKPRPGSGAAATAPALPAKAAAALSAGEYERALPLYRALSAQEGDTAVYAVIARFLEQAVERAQ